MLRLRLGPQIVVILLVVGLAAAMAVQPTRQLLQQRRLIEGMTDDLTQLREENRTLDTHVQRLRDPDYIEEQARELGLVRPGERSFVVVAKPSTSDKHERAREPTKPQPAPRSFVDRFLSFLGAV